MKESNELFELCKEVCTRFPEWKDTDFTYWGWADFLPVVTLTKEVDKKFTEAEDYRIPLYTSDYLLEKLPSPLIFDDNDCAIEVRRTKKYKYMWSANIRHSYGQYFKQLSDTPLKALLKLTLKLHEEGLL